MPEKPEPTSNGIWINHMRRLRFEHGEMTQQQLADLACVTRQTILALEAGRYNPSLELAFRIAKAFDLPLESVFEPHWKRNS